MTATVILAVHQGMGTELVRASLAVAKSPCSLLYSQLRGQVNNVRMVVSPLWLLPGNITGFNQDGFLLSGVWIKRVDLMRVQPHNSQVS